MIQAKPQTGTIISFSLFTLLTLIVLILNVLVIVTAPHPAWYTYAIVLALAAVSVFVIYKIFIQYKVIRMGNNEINIHYPVLRKLQKYQLNQVSYWTENQVKTGKKSFYRELEIGFDDGKKLKTAQKEYTDYDNMMKYLRVKIPRKRKAA